MLLASSSGSDRISLLRSSIIANCCIFFFRTGSAMRLPIKKSGLGCAIVLKQFLCEL